MIFMKNTIFPKAFIIAATLFILIYLINNSTETPGITAVNANPICYKVAKPVPPLKNQRVGGNSSKAKKLEFDNELILRLIQESPEWPSLTVGAWSNNTIKSRGASALQSMLFIKLPVEYREAFFDGGIDAACALEYPEVTSEILSFLGTSGGILTSNQEVKLIAKVLEDEAGRTQLFQSKYPKLKPEII